MERYDRNHENLVIARSYCEREFLTLFQTKTLKVLQFLVIFPKVIASFWSVFSSVGE